MIRYSDAISRVIVITMVIFNHENGKDVQHSESLEKNERRKK